ncbi:ETEC_3214 domain-containing protein [[Kitasatospora] papulosa]|uniref:ETEC_3214 domain-containing protein n=1 Tax=[Kitasatospora] papulosa TaxID=1464011 RepID=UPI00367D8CAD
MSPAPEPWYSTTLNVWTLAATIVATLTLMKTVAAGWRATIGRRRHVISRVRKVAPWVSPAYMEELFGEPTWVTSLIVHHYQPEEPVPDEDLELELTKRIWKLGRFGYLTTWSTDTTVELYGLTTTSRWFRPRLLVGDTLVKLGKTRINALPKPEQSWPWVGARRFTYIESFYFGNPGGYRTWYVGINDIGYQPMPPREGTEMSSAEHQAFRATARINTVLVGTAFFREASDATLFGNSFGPDQDQTRLLEPRMQLAHSRTAALRGHLHSGHWRWKRHHNSTQRRYLKELRRIQGNTAQSYAPPGPGH